MEAKDTVMGNGELQKGYCGGSYDVEYLIRRQAEISFKAGIREVVEWINSNSYTNTTNANDTGELLRDIRKFEWQAKLKEWGLTP